MVVSLLTAYNLTFSDSRIPMIHIVLPSDLLIFFNRTDIESPFDDKRQLQDFLAIVSRNFSQSIVENAANSNLMLQNEWKVLILMKSVMVYRLSLFNTILIILFITTCTILFIGNIFRFSWLQGNAVIRRRKHKQMYQCCINGIRVLRMLQLEYTGRNGQALHQQYTENAQNLYTFFGIHRQIALSNDMFLMNVTKTERWRKNTTIRETDTALVTF